MGRAAFGAFLSALLASSAMVACSDPTAEMLPSVPTDFETNDRWALIAESPLSPRSQVASAWTGQEMLIIGGSTEPPCPPAAGCIGPTRTQLRLDGAAYDPDSDSWRRLPDAPSPVVSAVATWTGEELVLLVPELMSGQSRTMLSFDPSIDRWEQLPPPPAEPYLMGGQWTGSSIVYWQSEESPQRRDWIFSLESQTWMPLSSDPFGSTFDRSYTWVGDRLIFTGLLTAGIDNDESIRDVYQVAEVRLGERGEEKWRELPPSDVGFWSPNWFWHDNALVNPSQQVSTGEESRPDEAPPGGRYDPGTGRWSAISEFDGASDDVHAGCELPVVGSAGRWLVGGGPLLVSIEPADVSIAPRCPELAEPAAGVWTGNELVIWGGSDRNYEHNQNIGLAWGPDE